MSVLDCHRLLDLCDELYDYPFPIYVLTSSCHALGLNGYGLLIALFHALPHRGALVNLI